MDIESLIESRVNAKKNSAVATLAKWLAWERYVMNSGSKSSYNEVILPSINDVFWRKEHYASYFELPRWILAYVMLNITHPNERWNFYSIPKTSTKGSKIELILSNGDKSVPDRTYAKTTWNKKKKLCSLEDIQQFVTEEYAITLEDVGNGYNLSQQTIESLVAPNSDFYTIARNQGLGDNQGFILARRVLGYKAMKVINHALTMYPLC